MLAATIAEDITGALGDPGPAARAALNQGCWLDEWLGTMSTMTLMPRA